MFPSDDYTPHGYLNTPTHTRNLNPRGVLRSNQAGFRWHFPAYTGMYGGTRESYQAGFTVGLPGLPQLADYAQTISPYHSQNLMAFELQQGTQRLTSTFLLVGEHTLTALIHEDSATGCAVQVEYTRLLAANGQWGESGLVARQLGDRLVLQGFEDGEVFLLAASRPWQALLVGAAPNPTTPLPDTGYLTVIGRRGSTVGLYATLSFAASQTHPFAALWPTPTPLAEPTLLVMLARGRTLPDAEQHLEAAQREVFASLAAKLSADRHFWATAPQISGDWPDHWRRGLVYDLETVRMMIRAPSGAYREIWDAMQIHAPRTVLAEAAMDALLLSYADPTQAQALLLATFRDTALPNVPCSREDGSFNMVAADGTICGTAPSWGYPFLVADWLWQMQPTTAWLAQIYPELSVHLDWWLAERCDDTGWLFYACSWESGQDDSPRFGAQPLGGGHPIRHIRPTDLTAAIVHACGVLARFADVLNRPADAHKWQTLAIAWRKRLGQHWDAQQQRYADLDGTSGGYTTVDDVMLLAPLALGEAGAAEVAGSAVRLAALDPAELTWPVPAWTAVEAALAAQQPGRASALAFAVVDRAYRYWDARVAQPGKTLPGIACEYWPLDGRCGGEGYGWGAFTTHLLLRGIVGLEPHVDRLVVRPNLPEAWRITGRSYRLAFVWRGVRRQLTLRPIDQVQVHIELDDQSQIIMWGMASDWR
jgi:hypothetical protein